MPWTVTVTVVPPNVGSVGFKVILPVDAFIASHVGMVAGDVIENVRTPQNVSPVMSPFVKLRESFITATSTVAVVMGIRIAYYGITVKLGTVFRQDVNVTVKETVEVIVG